MAESHSHTSAPSAPDFDPGAILKRNDPIFSLGVISLGLVLITYGGVFILGSMRTSNMTQIQTQIDTIDNEIKTKPELANTLKQYIGIDTVIKHIMRHMNARYKFNDNWNIIKQNVPKDMQFTTLSMSSDNTFYLTGSTKSVTSVANFAETLGKQPGITGVTPISIDKPQDSRNGIMDFSIRFKVSKAAKGAS